ncbi:ATP synthase regulation protein NCA2 [Novymonas esmeraldas]|uniref:ATP synthase regulation protein NCA2 n=1 Tax=Novymonas esmeraldas TaxID=1808958 RepID=A0AAW0F8H7_9TRYP
MTANGVDVRTPIFYRHSFARALEGQSSKVYLRLTHTPLIAENLPRGAATGARIEQYAAAHLHTLDDLEKLLRAVLDAAPRYHAGPPHSCSGALDGGAGDESHTTLLSPPGVLLQSGHTLAERGGRREGDAAFVRPTLRGGAGAASTAELDARPPHPSLPRVASLPVDPARAESRELDPAGAAARDVPSRPWQRLQRLLRLARHWGQAPLSPPAESVAPSTTARGQRGESASSAPPPPTVLSAASAGTAAPAPRSRVPLWVCAPFAEAQPPPPPPAVAAPMPAASAAQSMRWLRPSPARGTSATPCESAAASQRADARPATVPDRVPTAAADALRRSAAGRDSEGSDNDDEAASSHLTQTPHRYFDSAPHALGAPVRVPVGGGPTPGTSTFTAASASERDVDGATLTADESLSQPPLVSETTQTLAAAGTSDESSAKCADNAAASLSLDGASGVDGRARRRGGNGASVFPDEVRPLPLHRRDTAAADASTDLRSTGPSLSFSHTWHAGDAQSLPVPASNGIRPRAPASVASVCWDRHAYATELVGWLHLLVWVRWHVIHFLRDLSGVQGGVAWSAWYWSWAQEHPRHAAFHQALASSAFWRGVWSRGVSAQLNHVQYSVSRHMFTLKSVFQFIVSYIGAAYTALEQLNTLVAQVQRRCEVMMSPVAAAAVAAATAVTRASSAATPGLPHAVSTHRSTAGGGGGGGGYDLYSNQNSMFWSPIVTGGGDDEASPLAPRYRDRSVTTHGLTQSAFADTSPPGSQMARHGMHGDPDRDSVATAVLEEVEATSSLHAMDELRRSVCSMLQELGTMFSPDGLPLDVLETSDQVRFPWGGVGSAGLSTTTPASGPAVGPDVQGALPRPGDNILFGVSMLGAAAPACTPSAPQVHFADAGTREGSEAGGDRPMSVRDGAQVLLQCVHRSQLLLRRLTVLVQRAHSPPASRHWQRILVAAVTIVPPFMWLYTKSPAELTVIAQRAVTVGRQMLRAYLIEPVRQLREALFYVRPGVEDRRGAVERDAVSLANIIHDFHEDMYPDMAPDRLEELRHRTFERLSAGVADPEGLGLIDEQYRRSVRHPIRSVIFGDLPRIMLIQLSYQALEVSRVANGIDEVLEGNDLNFKIMAMMPIFLAGGLFATWSLFRYRVMYKPVRLRMKLLWRSLYRVVSFAGSGQGLVPPLLRIAAPRAVDQQRTKRHHGEVEALVLDFPRAQPDLAATATRLRQRTGGGRDRRRATSAGRDGGADVDEVDTAAFSESRSGSASSSDAAESAAAGAASARQLNNYEQGMVLLLSHVLRSMATEYLRSYAFFHELMEDLNDLESVQSTRHQRLATLERMRATHTPFF